ncbi:MAG TPA: methylated-DNA--[protein]-cysteine S-methyltransferase [Thermodesulfovibrionales bacterium]|nr:methylated-DNA--[protein]-cysteine S-methyltransferase [Thermodesulfovibrionales bacterium]
MSRRADIFCDTAQSPFGLLYLVFSGGRLAEIRFGSEKPPFPRGRTPESFSKQLVDYFSGKLRDFHQNTVFFEGTDFEQKVWLTLREIPYGETRTYKWLAERIENPKAVRAVGRALSRNPIPIVLPCHRIIESDGSIGGYSSGVEIKRRLLDMEYYYAIGKK